MISDIPSIPGVPQQLLQAINDRLRTLAGQLDNGQASLSGQIDSTNKTIDNLPPAPVTSVNAKTGIVILAAADVGATPTAGSYIHATTITAPSGQHITGITFDAFGRVTGFTAS